MVFARAPRLLPQPTEPYWSRTGQEAGWGRWGQAGLAPGGLSQRAGRQGGPSPCMLREEMVQECSSRPGLGPAHCVLALAHRDTAAWALAGQIGDA